MNSSKSFYNSAICITAGEQSENHVGMKINGNGLSDSGFYDEDLISYKKKLNTLGIDSEYYELDKYLDEDIKNTVPASLLIIKNGTDKILNFNNTNKKLKTSDMFTEQLELNWDTKYWDTRRSRVLNKHARYNICYGETGHNADFENKQGTIIEYNTVPLLKRWKENLEIIFGEKMNNLELEGNLYYDVKKCGIGFHGDSERKKVIACSLGNSRPLHWQWYQESKPVGPRIKFQLDNGDMYIMSEKTTGYDWKKRKILTLRHAAGEKYVK